MLLLRGPRTAAELRMRSERMHLFASVDDVVAVAEELAARGLAVRMERQPGRKEDRFAQVLCASELQVVSPLLSVPPPLPSQASVATKGPKHADHDREDDDLRDEVAELRVQVSSVRTDRRTGSTN